MKSFSTLLKFTFLVFVFHSSLPSFAQNSKSKELIGTWEVSRFKFAAEISDSTDIKNDSRGMTVTFLDGDEFITKKTEGGKVTIVDKGKYSLSADGRVLTQGGEHVQVILLTPNEFAFQMDETMIVYFKKKKG